MMERMYDTKKLEIKGPLAEESTVREHGQGHFGCSDVPLCRGGRRVDILLLPVEVAAPYPKYLRQLRIDDYSR